jgi:urease accessory protein
MSAAIVSLLLADGRLPTGGHAHSAGLEAALAAGMPAERVTDYLYARLVTVGRTEAAATVLSHRWARETGLAQAGPGHQRGLAAIQEELLARTPSAPLRTASGLLGRGMARLVARLWPLEPATSALLAMAGAPQRPVALGVATALGGMDELQAARACLYDDAQSVASAALKLLPVDPVEPVRWLLAAAPTLDEVAADSTAVSVPADIPALSAPLIEQWSLLHHLTPRRIFRA